MTIKLKQINENFENQVRSVTEMIEFDKLIIDFCSANLKTMNDRLKNSPLKINNPHYLMDNAILAIENINKNKSFSKHYSIIYNQCLVLLVSHFTLTIEEIFSTVIEYQFSNDKLSTNAKHKIQLSLDEINIVNKNPNLLKKFLIAKKKLSFQNIDNMIKSFENYLTIRIKNDEKLDDIRFAFECRHLIVHSVSKIDDRFIKQCNSIKKRNIKKTIHSGEKISFTKSELEFIKFSMLLFIQELTEELVSEKNLNP